MDFDQSKNIIRETYGTQADKLINKLCSGAICTLADLSKKNVIRTFSDITIDNLSQMEPHRQCGFIANPLIEFILGRCTHTIINQPTTVPIKTTTTISQSQIKPQPKPIPVPLSEPEPIKPDSVSEEEIPIDFF